MPLRILVRRGRQLNSTDYSEVINNKREVYTGGQGHKRSLKKAFCEGFMCNVTSELSFVE